MGPFLHQPCTPTCELSGVALDVGVIVRVREDAAHFCGLLGRPALPELGLALGWGLGCHGLKLRGRRQYLP